MTVPDNTTPHKAADYDQNVRQTIPYYETLHAEVLDLVKTLKPDASLWLDTGCGTGYLVGRALPLFPETEFILADPSDAMLEQARGRLGVSGGDRVRFLSPAGSDALASQMAGKKCQVLTAVQCHHYLLPSQRKEAVRSCFELLEEGGLYVTSENIAKSTCRGTEIGLKRWGQWQKNLGRSSSDVSDHLRRFNTEYFPVTVEQHLALLRGAGFRVVELFWLSHMQAGFYGIK